MAVSLKALSNLHKSLVFKLIFTVALTLIIVISIWAYFSVNYIKEKLMEEIVEGTARLTDTIRLGTYDAMMLNRRDDINKIINSIARLEGLSDIRIYNKDAEIKFSNQPSEVNLKINIQDQACNICHRTTPPLTDVQLNDRIRIFNSSEGYRLLGITSPIINETGCATSPCHAHPVDKKILGILDVVVSLEKSDKEIIQEEKRIIGLMVFLILITPTIIILFISRLVNRPIKKIIKGTYLIAQGEYFSELNIRQEGELGELASAINQMAKAIGEKHTELKRQRDEYQALFDQVPCLITVQDKNYRLLNFNKQFSDQFNPKSGDYCFRAYKGRGQKCVNCLVEKTFVDGKVHSGEEMGLNKDGEPVYWILRTSPVKNADGEIIATMEMSLDITEKRKLEEELKFSEKKYQEIFDNIPNPVFVIDYQTLEILDCNESVEAVYGYAKEKNLPKSFLDLFPDDEKDFYAQKIRNISFLNRAKHMNISGDTIFVNIRVSPAKYPGKKVLLVTSSDITKRLETEQQLIQASKMATLGEMASGIAHELNQPLSVIKTACGFFKMKINNEEQIEYKILFEIINKMDSNVDRATNIINNMREFARKSDMDINKIQVNEVIEKAFEFFSQQMKLREINVVWEVQKDLPKIKAHSSRLEQVFINLFLNARDAIEQRWGSQPASGKKNITIRSEFVGDKVVCQFCDTGIGVKESLRDKIFEPFFTTKEVGKGMGLGLSISYGIVKEFNGNIRVTSNNKQGTCFILEFPAIEKINGNS